MSPSKRLSTPSRFDAKEQGEGSVSQRDNKQINKQGRVVVIDGAIATDSKM